jgi:integrase
MAVYKRGKIWWYKFNWNNETIRESTKQSNKRIAEQMEAAHKTSLARGEVGIREKTKAPTLSQFLEAEFLPFVRATRAAKPKTIVFYENCAANLGAYAKLSRLRLDEIKAENISGYIAHRQADKVQVSTVNRDLATLRRALKLAVEWGKVTTILPKVRLLPGENRRERVLTAEEELKYLNAAAALGHEADEAYGRALAGIRAVKRGKQPARPDAYLRRDVATILLDCGLRPEECHRLRWQGNIRDGAIEIHAGKSSGSRRRIPLTPRALAALDMRRTHVESEWVFPAATMSGHIETSTLKKQHAKALEASKVQNFVLYDLRHTCLTRWAKKMDVWRLKKVAGHTDLSTTMRYVHMTDEDVREVVQSGHKFGHSDENGVSEEPWESALNV